MSPSPRPLPSVLVLFLAVASLLAPTAASAQDADSLWADFCHHILIANPAIAAEAAEALTQVESGTLLDAVEASRYENPHRIFERATGMEDVSEIAGQLKNIIQSARLDRSREPQRIAADILLLNQGQRAFDNATQRLKAAGQFAAPQMLAALIDPAQSDLHSALMKSMQEIGQPLVYPLSVAVPKLPPVAQGQVSQVLADIGYPQAMPALRQVIENPATDPTARQFAQAAIQDIGRNSRVPAEASAADLYLALGDGAYRTATTSPGSLDSYDEATDTGVVWLYESKLAINGGPGLLALVVPGPVVGDAVAMQAAEQALALNPDLDGALSLFVMANLRRENRLPEGEVDPSYSSDRQAPNFYAMVAGPQRLHDVLNRALDDQDTDLALDAIAALSATASLDALQPLTRGLGYPDRRVRFRAAEALAHAMPDRSFRNDFRVVPNLADVLRPADAAVALVIAPDQETRNALTAAISDQGFRPLSAPSLDEASGLIAAAPGIELVLVSGELLTVRDTVENSEGNYKLASTPILVVADEAEVQIRLSAQFEREQRVTVIQAGGGDLGAAIDLANAGFSGLALAAEESTAMALSSLALLKDIAVIESSPFTITDALPALVQAASDDRPEVATAAGDVLSRIDDPTAQAALTSASLSSFGDVQIAQLADLAASANAHGNLISAEMSDDILNLVKTSSGDTAVAAAQAHGALALPTRNAVDLILSK